MADIIQRKYYNGKALDVDTTGRRVKVAIGSIGNIDLDKDMITPGAVDRTIKERGPQGAQEIWHMTDHKYSLTAALSKYSEMGVEGNLIYGVAPFRNSFMWKEVAWPLYEAGDINQHSIGYYTIKSTNRGDYRELNEIGLLEGSAVLWGANPNTPVMELVKSKLGIDSSKDVIEQIEGLTKAIKNGKFSDEDHKTLLVIELKRIQASIHEQLKEATHEPAEEAADTPEAKEMREIARYIKQQSLIISFS